MIIEVLICIVIGYYFYREKSKKEEVGLENEKIKGLMDSLNRFVAKSEDLDRKHQKVLKLIELLTQDLNWKQLWLEKWRKGQKLLVEESHIALEVQDN